MPNSPARGGWKQNVGSTAGGSPGVRRTIALVALLAAAGGVAGLWFWIKPPSPIRFVIVPVAEYTDPAWPPNPWAARDSAALVALFPTGAESAFTFQERDRFVALLKALQGETARPVVMHITALGETRDGSVYILPGHAKPDDVSTWLPLAELLEEFKECKSPHKLLILDIAISLADPFRGPMNDVVAARLHEQLSKASLPFFVLTSCSAGEIAQPMTAAQATAFGYYLAEGLRGAADGYDAGGARDGRVSVRDLAAFTAARVNRWARANCAVSQTPALYGTADDFPLMFETRESPEPPGPRAYPPWLLEAWQARDVRREAGAYRVVPSAFTAAEAAILRAERLWIAGAEEAARRRLAAERDEYRARVDAESPVRPVPIRSLIVAQAGKPVPPDMATALESFLAVKNAVPPVKPEELQKASEAFATKAKAARTDATAAIWMHMVRDPEPSPERIKLLTDLLLETQPTPSTESLLARRLTAWQPRSIPWPAAAVHALLLAEDALGKTLALAPAAFPWIDKLLAAAATTYREGEAMLFESKTLDDVRAASERLTVAERDLRAVRRQWEVVQATSTAIASGTLLLMETAEGMIEGHRFDEAQWRAAASAATTLAEWLAKPPDGRGLPLAEWEVRLESWRRALAPLQAATSTKAVKDLLAKGEPSQLDWLLEGAWLSAADRAAAWSAHSKLMHKLHDETVVLDRADDESHQPTRFAKATADSSAPERAARRQHVSADLLRLAGLDGDATPNAWLVRLPKARADRIAKQDWIGASRLDRVAVFGDDRGGRPPAARQLRAEEQQCRLWLANWYAALGRLRATVPGATEFCDAAAADVRQTPRD